GHGAVSVAAGLLVYLLCYLGVWGGLLGLAACRAAPADPALRLLLGMGAAGLAAVFLLDHPAYSQFYFLTSARPYLSIAAVCGLAAVLPEPVGAARAGRVA